MIKKQRILNIFILVIFSCNNIIPAKANNKKISPCEYEEYNLKWSYPVRTQLKGSNLIDLNGDGQKEKLSIVAEINRDYAVDSRGEKISDEKFCWFNTKLEIRNSKNRPIYSHRWSIKFEDMYGLIKTAFNDSDDPSYLTPANYFAKFGSVPGFYRLGVQDMKFDYSQINQEVVEWSLKSQGVKGCRPDAIAQEVAKIKNLRVFVYNASWYEDRWYAAYVPSIARAVAIRRGIGP